MKDQTQNSPEFSNKLNQFFFFALIIAIGISFIFYITPFRVLNQDATQVKEIYFADNISRAHQIIIDRFNNQNAGKIKVIPIDLPFEKFTTNERKELLARSLRSKNSKFDIFAVDQIWVPRFSRWAEPLDRHISKSTIDRVRPELMPTLYHEGRLMSVPLFMDLGVLLYRRDLLEKLPVYDDLVEKLQESITWDDLLELRDNYFTDQEFYVFQADNYEGLICNYMEILNARSNPVFQEGKFTVLSEAGKRALKRIMELVETGATPNNVLNFSENDSYLYSVTNDIPFFRAWPSMLANLSLVPDSLHYKLDYLEIAPLPREKKNESSSVYGGWNLMVTATTENREACMEFIRFCLSDEAQIIMYNEGGFIPVMNSFYPDNAEITDERKLQQLTRLIQYGVHRPSHVKYSTLSDLLSSEIHKIITGKISIDTGLKQAQTILDKEIN